MSFNISHPAYDYDYTVWFDWDSMTGNNYVSDNGTRIELDELYLYSDGCLVNNGTNDCSTACLDVQKVWNDTKYNTPYTLHNCMYYPIVAQLLHANQLSDEGKLWAKNFNITNDTASPLFDSTPVITTCLTQYCQQANADNVPGCKQTGNNLPLALWSEAESDYVPLNLALDFQTQICQKLNAQVNGDIGGIGVFISYVMQIAIVMLGWVLWHISEHWTRYLAFFWYRTQRNAGQAWETACDFQEKLRISEFHDALIRALAEFQKAQVFFMLAVQIAAILAINNPSYIQATSWQGLWNNIGILFDLAFGGCLPVLFALLVLRTAGVKDLYFLIISTCSIGIAAATWFIVYSKQWTMNPDKNVTMDVAIDVCAGTSPTKFCYSSDWFFKNADASDRGKVMLAFMFVVQGCIILDQIRVFKPKQQEQTIKEGPGPHIDPVLVEYRDPKYWEHHKGLRKVTENLKAYLIRHGESSNRNVYDLFRDWLFTRSFWSKYEKAIDSRAYLRWLVLFGLDNPIGVWARFVSIIIFATEVALFGLNVVLLQDYGRLLLPNGDQYVVLDLKTWTLGQVIAVTVWIPILIEFIWDCWTGVEDTIANRYLPPRRMTMKRQDSYLTAGRTASDDGSTATASGVELMEVAPQKQDQSYELPR